MPTQYALDLEENMLAVIGFHGSTEMREQRRRQARKVTRKGTKDMLREEVAR